MGTDDDPRDEAIRRLRAAAEHGAPIMVRGALNTLANELQWSVGAVGGGWGALVAAALLDRGESS